MNHPIELSTTSATGLLKRLQTEPRQGTETSGWLLVDAAGGELQRLNNDLERTVREGDGLVLRAGWRQGLLRPFGALPEIVEELADWAHPRQPELLQRYGWSLINLLYPWRRSQAALPVGELRAGLADFVLRGDQTLIHQFFQKRSVRPQILSYLIQFVLAATAARPEAGAGGVWLVLEDAHRADELTVRALVLLNRYARHQGVPLTLVVEARRIEGTSLRVLEEEADEWRPVHLVAVDYRPPAALTGRSREAVEAQAAAAAFALPFRRRDWLELLDPPRRAVAEAVFEELAGSGDLRPTGGERWRFANGRTVEALVDACSGDQLRRWHRRLLDGEEGDDPFAAAWHCQQADVAELRQRCLRAMERAWAVSAYDTALAYAEGALAAPEEAGDGNPPVDGSLLLAMLHYEAERYAEADRHLRAALDQPRTGHDPMFLRYLLGYNTVFGLGDFALGIRILEEVLRHYDAAGDRRGAAYIRNSLAFAHFRSREVDEAIDLEQLALELIESAEVSDSFLLSILQLNLGRIYRNSGDPERALELFQRGLRVRRAEPSTHVLLLIHGTLGSLLAATGDLPGALAAYRHASELVRDMQVDSLKDQALAAFSHGVPELVPDRVVRTDALRYYIAFHLALICRRLGLGDRAEIYLAAIRAQAELLGGEVMQQVEAAFAGTPPGAASHGEPGPGEDEAFARSVGEALATLPDLISEVTTREGLAPRIATALADGRTVAIVRPCSLGAGAVWVESLVIYDPRRRDLAERVTAEIGGSHIPRATAALALPAAVGSFSSLAPVPLIQQTATLRPSARVDFAGLLPVGLGVQVLSPELDGLLFELTREFAARTGVGLLAAAPFHLWRRDLALTPRDGLSSFLVSSLDLLVLGDRLLCKTHGPTAAENLHGFRPRLSEEALVFPRPDDDPGGALLIRIKRRGGYATDDLLKLRAEVQPLLALCNGRLSIGDILQQAAPEQQAGVGAAERICGFLRDLWRRGALCFDEPAIAPPS